MDPPEGGSIVKQVNRRGAVGIVGIHKERKVLVEVKGCSHIGDANMEFCMPKKWVQRISILKIWS